MKLLRCHIVNYGCLHDFSFDFTDGINVIEQPNGWGKSTFASFLCAMLYGLESTTRRNLLDNERKHYRPWQGGNFGGWLEFEISDSQYRIERFFGQKEREDTFKLYDLKTMQLSQDYTKETGFELFGMDKAGYLRSIYVPQGKITSGYNDTLAARLARLTQSADDINAYEQSMDKIDAALRFYVKTGKRGEIARLEQEAVSIQQQLSEAKAARNQLADNTSRLSLLNQQKQQFHQQLLDIKKQITDHTRREMQTHHALLRQQLSQKELELEVLEDFFHDQLPEEDDINAYLQSCSHLSQAEQEQQIKAFTSDQAQDFCFLKNFFADLSRSALSDSSDLSNASDLSNVSGLSNAPDLSNVSDLSNIPDLSTASDLSNIPDLSTASNVCIFTDRQKKLLLDSPRYQSEATLLFPSEEYAVHWCYGCSSDDLPDLKNVEQAKKSYYEYRNCLTAQSENDRLIESIQKQMETLQKQINSVQNQPPSIQTRESSSSQKSSLLWASASIVLLIISMILGCIFKPSTGLIFGFVSEVICTLTFIYLTMFTSVFSAHSPEILSKNKNHQELHTVLAHLQSQYTHMQAQYDFALNRKNELQKSQQFCLKQIRMFSEQLHLSVDFSVPLTEDFLTLLFQLEQKLKQQEEFYQTQQQLSKKQMLFYNQLKKRYNHYLMEQRHHEQRKQKILNLRQDIIQYIQIYFDISKTASVTELSQKLNDLKLQLSTYKKLLADMCLASQNLNAFLQQHPDFDVSNQTYILDQTYVSDSSYTLDFSDDIAAKPSDEKHLESFPDSSGCSDHTISSSRPLSFLHQEESILSEQYTNCIQQISILQSQSQQLQAIAETAVFLEDKKQQLHQTITAYTKHYHILTLTKQYLTQARHNFTNNYLHSIEQHFHHYANLLEKDHLVQADINSDFHVLLSNEGILREAEWYSLGTRDLIDLCLRLSIIEDLFPSEQPFLILDDPFVNLDDFSLNKISSLLYDIGQKWQILYFTCHSSRNLENCDKILT